MPSPVFLWERAYGGVEPRPYEWQGVRKNGPSRTPAPTKTIMCRGGSGRPQGSPLRKILVRRGPCVPPQAPSHKKQETA